MRATVQFSGARSKEFDVCCKVKQGCVLAPNLFGIYFPDPGGVLLHTRCDGSFFSLARLRARTRVKCVLVHELLYPDDAAFVAHTEQEIQEMCNYFATACTEFGLTISLSKTVVMAQNVPVPPHVTINGTVLSVVEKFVYLGSTLKANNSLDAELNTRIGRASTTFERPDDSLVFETTATFLSKQRCTYMNPMSSPFCYMEAKRGLHTDGKSTSLMLFTSVTCIPRSGGDVSAMCAVCRMNVSQS